MYLAKHFVAVKLTTIPRVLWLCCILACASVTITGCACPKNYNNKYIDWKIAKLVLRNAVFLHDKFGVNDGRSEWTDKTYEFTVKRNSLIAFFDDKPLWQINLESKILGFNTGHDALVTYDLKAVLFDYYDGNIMDRIDDLGEVVAAYVNFHKYIAKGNINQARQLLDKNVEIVDGVGKNASSVTEQKWPQPVNAAEIRRALGGCGSDIEIAKKIPTLFLVFHDGSNCMMHSGLVGFHFQRRNGRWVIANASVYPPE